MNADALVGAGFYKLGYVTNDLERAIERFTATLGFGEFARFQPSLHAHTADGRSGPARLACAFSVGHQTVVELMQPLEGLVDIFREPLAGGAEIAFHHTGVLVDDLDAVTRSLPAAPAWRSGVPGRMGVTYTWLPALAHYVEHVQYLGDGGRFLASVRAPTRPG